MNCALDDRRVPTGALVAQGSTNTCPLFRRKKAVGTRTHNTPHSNDRASYPTYQQTYDQQTLSAQRPHAHSVMPRGTHKHKLLGGTQEFIDFPIMNVKLSE